MLDDDEAMDLDDLDQYIAERSLREPVFRALVEAAMRRSARRSKRAAEGRWVLPLIGGGPAGEHAADGPGGGERGFVAPAESVGEDDALVGCLDGSE